MGRKRPANGSWDEGKLYEHWKGRHTRVADVITTAEVKQLADVAALTREDYAGPELGSRHEYPVARVRRMGGGKELPEAVERRRQERDLFWEQRDADHARAMTLDQREREKRRYHAAPEDVTPTFRPRRYRTMAPAPWGEWSPWQTVTRNGTTMQERMRQRS